MTTSLVSQGMAMAFSRMTVAAPTSSSTVLPLAAKPTSKPPICASLARPDMMCMNASRDSARVRSSRRQSLSRISCSGTDMGSLRFAGALFDDLSPGGGGGDEGGRGFAEFFAIGALHVLDEGVDGAGLGQGDDAAAETAAGHAGAVDGFDLHRLDREEIELGCAD